MGALVPTTPGRVASLMALVLGAVLLVHCREVADEASYLGVLAGVLGLVGLASGVRLWLGCRCAAPICAVLLSAAVLTGQVLNLAVGLPGAPGLRSELGGTSAVLVVLEVALIGLVLAGGLFRTPAPVPPHKVTPWLPRS